MLFHVLWSALFRRLENMGETQTVAKLKQHHFVQNGGKLDAPWRSCPDRIMPGTDVGTAPQESWHNAILIPACEFAGKSPFLLARRLQESIVAKDLQRYQAMAARGETLQDCLT
eukprot:s324_g2.t1